MTLIEAHRRAAAASRRHPSLDFYVCREVELGPHSDSYCVTSSQTTDAATCAPIIVATYSGGSRID